MALTLGQTKTLRAKGIAQKAIDAYNKGTAAPGVKKQIEAVLQQTSSAGVPGFQVNPHGGGGVSPTGGVPQRVPNPSSTGTSGYPTNPKSPTLANPPYPDYGGRGRVDPMPDQPGRTDLGGQPAPVPTVPTGTGTNPYTPFQYDPGTNPYGIPQAPAPFDFQIPSIEMRDFTEQAKKIAAEAFAPYLAAFDIARSNAQAQGKTSKEATAGLYANFTKDIAAKAAETAERYDDIKAEQASRGEAQQADIQENTQSANANIGGQLAALGLQTSIPTALEQGASEQVTAQNDAAAATESQQQFMDTQQVAQGNYDTQYGNIMQHQGMVAQGDLESQLMNILAGIDINKANASGEQAGTALELAQSLADRDFQMQAQNAGLSMQGQQLEAGQQQSQFENLLGQHNTWEGENQQNYKNAFELWAAEQGFNIDAMAAAGQAGGSEFDMGDYPDQTQTYGWLVSQLGPQLGSDVHVALGDIFQEYLKSDARVNAGPSLQERRIAFARFAQDKLAAKGIDPSIANAAAMNYFTQIES